MLKTISMALLTNNNNNLFGFDEHSGHNKVCLLTAVCFWELCSAVTHSHFM